MSIPTIATIATISTLQSLFIALRPAPQAFCPIPARPYRTARSGGLPEA